MAPDSSRTRTWAFVLAIGCVAGCDDAPPTAVVSEIDSAIVEPNWSGCWLLGDGRRCQLSHAPLRVWFAETEPSWRWTVDDETTDPTVEDADGGVRFSFDTSAFEPGLHTLALWDAGAETPLFTLELVPDPMELNNFEFGDEVKEALASSFPEVHRDAAEALLASPSASGVEKTARLHYARKLTYDEVDPGDSAKAVLALLEREERVAAEEGLWGVRCEAALVGLYWGTLREDPDLLLRWGQLEEQCRGRSAGLAARFDHYLGKQALLGAAYAEAEARLSSVLVTATRVLPEQSVEASNDLMDLYARTGRWSEAQRELESLQALPLGVCERANAESWIGFVRIRARQSAAPDLGDPGPGLEAAEQAHAQGPCKNVGRHTHDLVKLGYAAALRGDDSALRGYLDRISQKRLDGKYRHQAAELELELAVAERRFADVPALASAMDTLMTEGEPEAQWRRHMILAKSALAQNDNAAVQDAYVAAEAVLDDLWAGVSSDAVRARWLGAYRRSALGLLRVRLEAGDLEGAACAARSARRRALDLPDEPDTNHEACGRAWARGEGEAVFLIVPETDEDWYVFVIVDERVVQARQVPAPSSERDARWWDLWMGVVGSARRVRILASGAALRSPLHQLGWRGQPLIRQRPVTFGLDLDPGQTQGSPVSPAASVVFADADPYRSLSRYAADLRDVHATLKRGGWSPRWLETSAGGQTLADAVRPGGLLVYYGHGERVRVGGSTALSDTNDVGSTALLVARDARWGVADVSALEDAPRWAVLLGCDVAFSDGRSWSGGLNLAHALLLAGTHEVLAATGPIDAAVAAEVGVPLLTAAEASERFELSDALHRMWAASPDSGTQPPLGALRVWSR